LRNLPGAAIEGPGEIERLALAMRGGDRRVQ